MYETACTVNIVSKQRQLKRPDASYCAMLLPL